jgi:hydrogenase expression/formation protein HypC
MCLAVPLKIISIDNKNAVAEIGGISRRVRLDFLPGAGIGDYVIVHAGFAIEKLSEESALENLKAIREVSDAFQE